MRIRRYVVDVGVSTTATALPRSADRISSTVAVGLACFSSAQAPAMWGAAIDVPAAKPKAPLVPAFVQLPPSVVIPAGRDEHTSRASSPPGARSVVASSVGARFA